MNLLTSEIEDVAERVKLRVMARGRVHCYVGPAGKVQIVTHAARHGVRLGPECLVGSYTREARTADIEDDLVARLRELVA